MGANFEETTVDFSRCFLSLFSLSFEPRGSKLVVRNSGEVDGRKDSVETRFPDSRRKEKSLLPENRTDPRAGEREKK